jgi:hypothetical protein
VSAPARLESQILEILLSNLHLLHVLCVQALEDAVREAVESVTHPALQNV